MEECIYILICVKLEDSLEVKHTKIRKSNSAMKEYEKRIAELEEQEIDTRERVSQESTRLQMLKVRCSDT